MSISRKVDSSTVNLMQLAMHARAKPAQSLELSPITADLHLIGAMTVEDKNIYTWVKIHLETVHVTDWEISADGDDRPTETVKIQYGRAAMCYQGTPDGVLLDSTIDDGWDQWTNERWRHFLE